MAYVIKGYTETQLQIRHRGGSHSFPGADVVTFWVNYGWYETILNDPNTELANDNDYIVSAIQLLSAGF